jgi:hypothetical protein
MSATVNNDEVPARNAYAMIAAGYTVIVVYMCALLEPIDEQVSHRVLTNAMYTLLHLP